MSYPGNESLSLDIKRRILETFRQTLELTEQESRKEALLGCDFILRLDPLFEPARWLQDRLETVDEQIFIDDLRTSLEGAEQTLGAGLAETAEPPATPADAVAPPAETAETPAPAPEPAAGPAAAATAPADSAAEAEPVESAAPEAAAPPAEAAAPPAENAETAPPAPAPVIEGAASEPAAALDSESEQRIQELLAEGQEAFDATNYQAAIDAWSRIFLIDIDHPEANRRIELARKLKAEVERSIEEAFHEAISHFEAGSPEKARSALERVLEMQPDHLAAREYLQKLDAAEAPPPDEPEEAPEQPEAPPPPEPELEVVPEPEAETLEMPNVPAAAGPRAAAVVDTEGPAAAVPIPKPRAARKSGRKTRGQALLYVGAGVLALVLVGGWFLFSNWSRIFPNASQPDEAAVPATDPLTRARDLHSRGRTPMAIAQLRRLSPSHPMYAEAQSLIAQWERLLQPEAEAEAAGPSPEDLARREELIAAARRSYGEREFLRADELFDQAAAIAALDGSAAELQVDVDSRLEPLRQQVNIFRQGEWEMVLRDLWRMREQDPGNRDILRLMADSYYNLGVRDLQRGDIHSAGENFAEGAALDADDPALARLVAFARTYQDRPEDLLYRIFVKYLPFR